MKIAACVIVKNEERDFLEWICFHLAVGFDTILVYDNHSTDRTNWVAQTAKGVGDIRVRKWDEFPHQRTAYAHALQRHRAEFDWIAFIDSDEFLFSPSHRNIKDVLDQFADVPALGVHWLCYGSNGAIDFSNKLLIEEFTRRGAEDFSANRHIKTILQPKRAIEPTNVHVFVLKKDVRYRRADGTVIKDWIKPGKCKSVGATEVLRINHYFVRSRTHYARKLARGGANHTRPLRDVFDQMDRNEIFDDAALVYRDDVRALIDRVRAYRRARFAARKSVEADAVVISE